MEKVYITKYVFSKGIQTVSEYVFLDHDNIQEVNPYWNPGYHAYYTRNIFKKGEWHKTLKDAKVKAEKMRLKKIDQLSRTIAKLKKINF
jgi:hypothetical protein